MTPEQKKIKYAKSAALQRKQRADANAVAPKPARGRTSEEQKARMRAQYAADPAKTKARAKASHDKARVASRARVMQAIAQAERTRDVFAELGERE